MSSAWWKYEKERMISQRLFWLIVFFAVLFMVLIGRMFYLQIVKGDVYLAMADKNRISTRLTLPARGYIYDRNGVKLAENQKTFQAVLFREETDDYKKTLDNFNKIIPLDEDEIERIYKEMKRKKAFMPVRIKNNLSFEEMALIQLNAPDLKGIQTEEEITRYYPLKEYAAHAVGYVSFLTEKDMAHDKESPLLDLVGYRIGRVGVEEGWENTLQGTPGMRQTEINAYGRSVRVLEEEKPKKGQNLTLTIDARLPEFAVKAMGEESGSVIVVDIHTGEILTLVSTPSYDTNIFTKPIPKKIWADLIGNEKRPLQNKAINGVYSPGSIFKLIVALAGLESGHITADKKVFCSGKTQIGKQYFHCWSRWGHGKVNLEEALMHSCDVYFYELAQEIGPDKILEVTRRLGFGEKVGLNLTGEKSGLVPSRQWKKEKLKDNWRVGDTLNLSIGQGFLNVTPIQIVKAVAEIANGGYPIQPHLIKEDTIPNIQNQKPLFKKHHLKLVHSGMNMVVNHKKGTGHASQFDLNGQKMAGKTASIQVRRISMKERESGVLSQDKLPWKYRDHAMFAAFAPVNNPRYAIIVAVEHGGGGSRTAAPIAGQVLKETLRLYSAEDNKTSKTMIQKRD